LGFGFQGHQQCTRDIIREGGKMSDFAIGWKIILFIAEVIIFLVIAISSAKLLNKEEQEFLADKKKGA
jgi:hypothetical protein